MTAFLLEWAGLACMFAAGWIVRGSFCRPEREIAMPEPPAQVDRPAGTNRCTVNVAGHALYVTTSMDSGQLMRK